MKILKFLARRIKHRHMFDISRIVDLKKDPVCIYCGKKLSEIGRKQNEENTKQN